MSTSDLTKRQKQILDFISICVNEKHCPPSVREIGEAIGLSSPSTVHAHLNALEQKGYIKRDGAKSRSMSITSKAQSFESEPSPSAPSQAHASRGIV